MTTWTRVGLYHALSFMQEAPSGCARCQRCDQLVTLDGWTAATCSGVPPAPPSVP
jgi:hypothetical protein